MFRRLKSLPPTAVKAEVPADKRLVVAHSETGHHHVIDGFEGGFYRDPSVKTVDVCYLQMGVDVCDFTIDHLRPYDTHETFKLKGEPGAVWEVRRQRESAPEGWRQVQD